MNSCIFQDLNLLDISKTGHRKKLLSEVAKLPPTNRVPVDKPVRFIPRETILS